MDSGIYFFTGIYFFKSARIVYLFYNIFYY